MVVQTRGRRVGVSSWLTSVQPEWIQLLLLSDMGFTTKYSGVWGNMADPRAERQNLTKSAGDASGGGRDGTQGFALLPWLS